MILASVTATGRGATDRLLSDVVSRLTQDGLRVLGALRAADAFAAPGACDCDLWLLPDGPLARITQDLGAGSQACRMDAGAMQQAVGLASARLERHGADLVVLNKFGQAEAEGRGFRPLIAEAVAQGIPVLIGLSDTHRAAFGLFAGPMAEALPPQADAVLAWCRQATQRAGAARPGETAA
ncbi:MAG: DUF2478 domain-containing protein [Paracoccaceae bacterium]